MAAPQKEHQIALLNDYVLTSQMMEAFDANIAVMSHLCLGGNKWFTQGS